MTRGFFSLLISILFIFEMNAQTIDDAVNYSLLNRMSSARSVGVGNAFMSLGADLSTASTNPAGIAEFRKSEFVLSIDFMNRTTTSMLDGNTQEQMRSNAPLSQIAAVFVKRNPSSKLETFNLAIGMNTTNIFHQSFNYEGNSAVSLVDRFLERADEAAFNGFGLDFFEEGLADELGLISLHSSGQFYESVLDSYGGAIPKTQFVTTTGVQREVFLSVGANVKNKLSIGGTIGVPIIRRQELRDYRETDPGNAIAQFESLDFIEFFETNGVGLNAKIGAIYKVTDNLRIGASVHSPSFLFMKDVATTDLLYNGNESLSPEGVSEYQLTTPLRILGGASYLIRAGKFRGFISGEAEWASYPGMKYSISDDPDFATGINNDINDFLTSALAIRAGAELGYGAFRLRLGYEDLGNPFLDAPADPAKLSVGIGIRRNRSYFDLAYQFQDLERIHIPFFLSDLSREIVVDNEVSNRHVMLTAGFKF